MQPVSEAEVKSRRGSDDSLYQEMLDVYEAMRPGQWYRLTFDGEKELKRGVAKLRSYHRTGVEQLATRRGAVEDPEFSVYVVMRLLPGQPERPPAPKADAE